MSVVYHYTRVHGVCVRSPRAGVMAAVSPHMVVGIKPGSSGRAAGALHHQAKSPAPRQQVFSTFLGIYWSVCGDSEGQ